ncbi:DUF1592 domain-containing protein [Flavicella sediminum]|uniref:DUF1592 domain-containing protein n=1 Tax=Flavicella sediminum TaxID=2585141 RepID=UPI00111DD2D8|nr:DUF1592 domain-containing protein [Flavicella sediminum]
MKLVLSIALVFTLSLLGLAFVSIVPEKNDSIILFFGNFHPLLLHIPIGTLLGVLVLEIIGTLKPKLQVEGATTILLWFTVISVLPTVVLGFFLAASGGYNPEKLFLHKWLGWATALVSVWLLVLRTWTSSKSDKFVYGYKFILFVNVLLLSVAGHFGGSLTHGSDYLTKDMPAPMKAFFGVEKSEAEALVEKMKAQPKDSIAPRTLAFLDTIHPLLDKNCFECHNADKQKGDLRLDVIGYDFSNPADLEKWEAVWEEVKEGNMPPEEKDPLTEQDRENLLEWISTSLEKRTPEQKLLALETKIAKQEKKKKERLQLAIAEKKKPKVKLSKEGIHYTNKVKPILAKYCFGCHGVDKQKGEMRLDILHWNMKTGGDAEKWHSALDEINAGEMPPKKKPQMSDAERRLVVDWITNSLSAAADAKRSVATKVTRRLTKSQYTNSLNELLNLPINFGYTLPNDGKSKMGFTNNGNILQISSLHIDYYQKIAREALDKAIVFGEKPESKSYKVTFGKGIGEGGVAAEFGGFQSVAIKKEDFLIELLDSKGNVKQNVDPIKKKIGIGMRGSASDRYSVEENGMMLYSALPHKDVPPRSWQGPSPNMKMLIKNNFPTSGSFVFRVQASKGYALAAKEGLIGLREDKPATVNEKTIVLTIDDVYEKKNIQKKDDKFLVASKTDAFVTAKLKLKIKEEGFYQIDLVHPYAPAENMPSFAMKIGSFNKVQERLKLDPSLATSSEIVTPVTLGLLKKGSYTITLSGKFFVGFSEIRVTPLSEDNPLPAELKAEAAKNQKKYENLTPSIRAFVGSRTDDGMDYKTFDTSKEVTSAPGVFKTYEFTGQLENLPLPVKDLNETNELSNTMIIGLWNDHLVKQKGENGPPILLKSAELITPYHPVWPPESHTAIFFDSPNKDNEELYTAEVLKKFMEKAYRRPLVNGELTRYLNFWKAGRADFDRYEDSVKEVLVAVLCSPNFLYLLESEKKDAKETDEFLLASKMSYFLWNSPPDKTLTNLARHSSLKKDLPNQIKRMSESPKIWKMIKAFTYEWLRVDRLKSMTTNKKIYPDFTRFVKEDMAEETYNFMHHVLAENLSILNFIDSDFAMLNQNLAEFYGVAGVKGNQFRPVAVKPEEHRGGLLSQGAFLTGHSDGVQAHPIKRAVWLKEKILGDPPPPPPPNVPELDPETPGFEKMTLKEQLELHRNKASCIDCHLKIDPYGVAFENYDAVGRFREEMKGKPVDSKSKLPDGTEVIGVQGIKSYILSKKKEEFTKSLVEHLYAYALGRDTSFSDEKELKQIVENVKKDNYKFQTVLEQIVLSPSFQGQLN